MDTTQGRARCPAWPLYQIAGHAQLQGLEQAQGQGPGQGRGQGQGQGQEWVCEGVGLPSLQSRPSPRPRRKSRPRPSPKREGGLVNSCWRRRRGGPRGRRRGMCRGRDSPSNRSLLHQPLPLLPLYQLRRLFLHPQVVIAAAATAAAVAAAAAVAVAAAAAAAAVAAITVAVAATAAESPLRPSTARPSCLPPVSWTMRSWRPCQLTCATNS